MRPITSILILLSGVILLQGCGSGSFLGQRYDNFTAYYNTFYNAERVFEQGYEGVGQTDERIDRTEFLPVFVRPQSGSRAGEFESAIEKSADVLRDHPDSKWVDDALMLIGKSYFYRENFVGAIQKFREVVALGTGREAEGRFWLARTLIISGAFDEAETELFAALAEEDLDRRWAARYRLALGELNVIEEDWEAAATELSAGLEDVRDDELAARAWFTLGQVYEKLGRYDEAADAYRTVRKNSPPYELSYAAAYSATRVEGFHGDVEDALSNVRKLERDDKNLEYQSEIRLLRAQILQRRGRDDEAFAIYSDLLYNPNRDLSMAGLRGRVHYSLAELYRDIDGDYVLAAAHFDTARTNMKGGSRRQAVASEGLSGRAKAPEAIADLDLLVDSYNAYAEAFGEVARLDSLLHLGSLPREEFEERILELRRQRAEELERQRELLEEMQRNQQFNRQSGENPFRNTNQGLPPGKTIPDLDQIRGESSSSEAGFLGVDDAIRVQEGQVGFVSRWGERPLVPNWRRQAAISNVEVADNLPSGNGTEVQPGARESEELPEIDISAVPRDSTARLAMKRQRALARYELGNTLFLGMNRPDSAAVWYRMVLDERDSTDVSQRALYALAEVQYSLGDTTAATQLYQDILDRYPGSDFSDNVRERLGIEREEAASDSTSAALSAYSDAFAVWNASNTHAASRLAFNEMLRVAGTWPETDAGARSLLSATEIHLELAGADSSRIFGHLPVTVDDAVLEAIWPRKAAALANRVDRDSAPDSTDAPGRTAAKSDGAVNEVRADSVDAAADPVAGLVADPVAAPDSAAAMDGAIAPPDSAAAMDGAIAAPDSTEAVQNTVAAAATLDDAVAQDEPQQEEAEPGRTSSEEHPVAEQSGLSLFGHVAVSDSLVLAVLPPGTASAIAPGVRLIPIDDGGAFMMTQRLSPLAAELRVQDLLEAVGRLHPRTPYATRAQRLSGLLDELLVVEAPVDSAAVDSAAVDSAGRVLAGARADSLGDDPNVDSLTPADSIRIDADPGDVADQRPRTREDSLAVAALSGKQRFVPRKPAPPPADSLEIHEEPAERVEEERQAGAGAAAAAEGAEADGKRDDEAEGAQRGFIPAENERREGRTGAMPDTMAAARDAIEATDEPPVDLPAGLVADPAQLEAEGIRMSSSLRPLTAEGQPDLSAIGWTVVFQSSRDVATAQLERRRFKTLLAEQGDPLQLLVHTKSEEPEVLVAWGLFDTRAELQIALDIARRETGETFPDEMSLLVLMP